MSRCRLLLSLVKLGSCVSALVLLAGTPLAHADTWRGTAPFCAGSCLGHEIYKGSSSCGDGACCITGSKVLCGNASQSCRASATRAECYGVVMICENGSNRVPDGAWIGCNSYACGACIGFGETGNISILSKGGSAAGYVTDVCKPGFVWREAVPGDKVCVVPPARDHARNDNALAVQRRSPNGGAYGPATCKPGYIWREATQDDRVCVSPDVRSQTHEQNRLAATRRVDTAASYRPVVCRQGFVWREAVRNDHVCVTPDTRARAARDNASATARRQANGVFGPDSCVQGYVWREVIPSDRVCVTPAERGRVADDNAKAAARRA